MAITNQQVAEVSQLVCEQGVEALIASPDPILNLMYKGYNKDFDNAKYQSGSTIYIRIEDQPAMPLQQTEMVIDPIVQSEISATVLNYTTGWNLNTAFEALSMGGPARLRERVTKPRGKQMAVQAATICYNQLFTCPGFISSYAAGTAFKTGTDFGFARAALKNQQAHSGLCSAMTPDDMAQVAGDLATRFNPEDDSAFAYTDGEVKKASSLMLYESTLIPNHTNGTATNASMVLSSPPASGATSIAVSGGTSAGTFTVNSIIYINGVFEINPDTKQPLSNLRGFTVTANVTLSGGAGTIPIFPAIVGPENPKMQTCSSLPTNNSVLIYGVASGVYRQMLFFRRDSSAFISVKQEELIKAENGMADMQGVVIQTASSGDIFNRQNLSRLDLLATAVNTQWRHQYRVFTAKLN